MAPADILRVPFPLIDESGPTDPAPPLPNLSRMLVQEM